ncbi:Centromere/kinetochore protein zw10, partial [Nowakowskiella sp. JEL0078]
PGYPNTVATFASTLLAIYELQALEKFLSPFARTMLRACLIPIISDSQWSLVDKEPKISEDDSYTLKLKRKNTEKFSWNKDNADQFQKSFSESTITSKHSQTSISPATKKSLQKTVFAVLGDRMWKPVTKNLIENVLTKLVPSFSSEIDAGFNAKKELSDWDDEVAKWVWEFEEELVRMGLISYTQTVLSDFCADIDALYALRSREYFLNTARQIILNPKNATKTCIIDEPLIPVSNEKGSTLLKFLKDVSNRNPNEFILLPKLDNEMLENVNNGKKGAFIGFPIFPKCSVSDCSHKIVEIFKESILEASRMRKTKSALVLLLTARDIIDLYRAIFPMRLQQLQSGASPSLAQNTGSPMTPTTSFTSSPISSLRSTIGVLQHSITTSSNNSHGTQSATISESVFDSIAKIPFLGTLFYNDCMFIAHNVMVLGSGIGRDIKDEIKRRENKLMEGLEEVDEVRDGEQIESIVFIDLAIALRQTADDVFKKVLKIQKDQIREMFNEAQGFEMPDGARFDKVKRVLFRVADTLERMDRIWKDILPSELHLKSISALCELGFKTISAEILALVDIAEDECSWLHNLMTLFFERLEKIIASHIPAQSYLVESEKRAQLISSAERIHKFTPSVVKYAKLAAMLDSPFADIMEEFRKRRLREFSVTELSSLIKAIFADSPLRVKNLEEIGGLVI